MYWYRIGLLLLGVCVGLLTGLSQSPVVSVLLPLLFSLIAGTSGFFAATAIAKGGRALVHLDEIGKLIIWFVAPILVFALYGAAIRTDSPLSAYLAPFSSKDDSAFEKLYAEASPEDKVLVAQMRGLLRKAGLNDQEAASVAEAISKKRLSDADGKTTQKHLKVLIAALEESETALTQALAKVTPEQGKEWPAGSYQQTALPLTKDMQAAVSRHRAVLDLYVDTPEADVARVRADLLRDIDGAVLELRGLTLRPELHTVVKRWDPTAGAHLKTVVVALMAAKARILADAEDPLVATIARLESLAPASSQAAAASASTRGIPDISYDDVLRRIEDPLTPFDAKPPS